jgi:predicted SAM-dependent methyltransferase
MKILELGSGSVPLQGAVHHDRIKHSEWIDVAWDLEVIPWPCENEEWDEVYAIDVFEHLNTEIVDWLSECHRILKVGGKLTLRLPAWDNELSYRDPTHKKVFHHETFDYFDPEKELYELFGRYYWDNVPLFQVTFVGRENNDLRFELIRR